MADESELPAEVELPIEWYVPDNMVSRYATNMVIQHTEHEFVVSFFETAPPLLIGTPTKEQIEGLKSIRAECVARVIVAKDRMPRFIEALQTNLERALSKSQAEALEKK